jgi:hypothetical protein
VAAAGEQAKAALGVGRFGGLGEDAAAAGDHRVGRDHEGGLAAEASHDRGVLGLRQAQRVGRRLLAGGRGLVDLRRFEARRLDAGLAQQRKPAR